MMSLDIFILFSWVYSVIYWLSLRELSSSMPFQLAFFAFLHCDLMM